MGNLLACGQGHQFTQAEFVQADNMVGADQFDCIICHDIHSFLQARVCRMRKQVLAKQHAELLLKAKDKVKEGGQCSVRPMALQLKQMKQQMDKMEEVEMNFINIASISQTTGALQSITQQYNTARDEREKVDLDEVLDLQDALREQQQAFAEIDQALAQACK